MGHYRFLKFSPLCIFASKCCGEEKNAILDFALHILYTVTSHENRTITRFSRIASAPKLCIWSPWVPLHRMHTPRIPTKRF